MSKRERSGLVLFALTEAVLLSGRLYRQDLRREPDLRAT